MSDMIIALYVHATQDNLIDWLNDRLEVHRLSGKYSDEQIEDFADAIMGVMMRNSIGSPMVDPR